MPLNAIMMQQFVRCAIHNVFNRAGAYKLYKPTLQWLLGTYIHPATCMAVIGMKSHV